MFIRKYVIVLIYLKSKIYDKSDPCLFEDGRESLPKIESPQSVKNVGVHGCTLIYFINKKLWF